jgi:predicted RNase H-like HicB family nuclease
MEIQLTAVFQEVPEGYIAFVAELPGTNTQGATLDEARGNLHEAISVIFEANRVLAKESLDGQDVHPRTAAHRNRMSRGAAPLRIQPELPPWFAAGHAC